MNTLSAQSVFKLITMTEVSQTTRIKNKSLAEVRDCLFSYASIIETFKSGFEVSSHIEPDSFVESSVLSMKIFKFGFLCPTEFIIKTIKPKEFSYSQKKGILKKWSHKVSLVEMKSGINIVDEVKYEMPFGLLGHLTNDLFLRAEIKDCLYTRLKSLKLK